MLMARKRCEYLGSHFIVAGLGATQLDDPHVEVPKALLRLWGRRLLVDS